MTSTETLLGLSTRALRTVLTSPDQEILLRQETLVVNPSGRTLVVETDVPLSVRPLTSAVLNRVTLRHPEPLLLLTGLADEEFRDLGSREEWTRIGDDPAIAAGAGAGVPFPTHTPLWRSPIEQLGTVTLPSELLGGPSAARASAPLRLQANLWYAPGGTDCHIHRKHEFLEVHTQVCGQGRMQKFHAQDVSTCYQYIPLEPGTTHAPFCTHDAAGTWQYPWHRYWADTACVWLALEYHPS